MRAGILLQRVEGRICIHLIQAVSLVLWGMLSTIDRCSRIAGFPTHINSANSIFAGLLHRIQVEQKVETILLGTRGMHRSLALGTVDASALYFLALLALCRPFAAWDSCKTLCVFQQMRLAELDFWMEDSADDMDPVVSRRSFERLSRRLRSTFAFLLCEVEFGLFVHHFFFQSFLFALTIRLLFVGDSRGFH